MGIEDGIFITTEEENHKDILQTNFIESHYNLSLKDVNFFKYIEQNCKHADYIFKGDDDIMLIPENAMYEITRLKNQPVCLKLL